MHKTALDIKQLEIYQPLVYVKDQSLEPFNITITEGEVLFCMEAEKDRHGGFCCGRVLEAGRELFDGEIHEEIFLPAGNYLFTQEKRLLNKDEIMQAARAVEDCAASAGTELDKKCYLRYLFEDGKIVTQIFWAEKTL